MRLFEVAFSFYLSDSKRNFSNFAIKRFKNNPFRTLQSDYTYLINPHIQGHIPLPFVRESCIAVFGADVWCFRNLCIGLRLYESLLLNGTSSDIVPHVS